MTAKSSAQLEAPVKQYELNVLLGEIRAVRSELTELITKDALELAILRERAENDRAIDRAVKDATKNWAKGAWVVASALAYLLITSFWSLITNQGKL